MSIMVSPVHLKVFLLARLCTASTDYPAACNIPADAQVVTCGGASLGGDKGRLGLGWGPVGPLGDGVQVLRRLFKSLLVPLHVLHTIIIVILFTLPPLQMVNHGRYRLVPDPSKHKLALHNRHSLVVAGVQAEVDGGGVVHAQPEAVGDAARIGGRVEC